MSRRREAPSARHKRPCALRQSDELRRVIARVLPVSNRWAGALGAPASMPSTGTRRTGAAPPQPRSGHRQAAGAGGRGRGPPGEGSARSARAVAGSMPALDELAPRVPVGAKRLAWRTGVVEREHGGPQPLSHRVRATALISGTSSAWRSHARSSIRPRGWPDALLELAHPRRRPRPSNATSATGLTPERALREALRPLGRSRSFAWRRTARTCRGSWWPIRQPVAGRPGHETRPATLRALNRVLERRRCGFSAACPQSASMMNSVETTWFARNSSASTAC